MSLDIQSLVYEMFRFKHLCLVIVLVRFLTRGDIVGCFLPLSKKIYMSD
jgi:hypothetical protein